MKLIDMEIQEWRSANFKKYDVWRTNRVYRCGICGCKSNKFVMMQAFWGGGPRLHCPGSYAKYDLHNLLQEKVVNSRQKNHPNIYRSLAPGN